MTVMEGKSLQRMRGSPAKNTYVARRLLIVLVAASVIIIGLMLLSRSSQPLISFEGQNKTSSLLPPPFYEREATPREENQTIPVEPEPEVNCTTSPVVELGCLEENPVQNIFSAAGLTVDDDVVEDLIEIVERSCDTDGADGFIDRDCIIDTAVYNSENSWVCEWECLEDLASCETYKMHLAVAVLRRYVPPEDVFVARTDDFHFFLLYKDNQGAWIQKFAYGMKRPYVEAVYNDMLHAGPITEVIFPEILTVDQGEKFCFDVYADRSCVCSVNVEPFIVGECPQLPADLRAVCDKPVSEVYLNVGKNSLCFTVSEDAAEQFYTYNFVLGSGEEYIPAGNAFIKQRKWDCCVNASFKGFLSVED